ncbi:hypothetical protein [Streptomyces rimosus]|uniref:hypothetical protein n=1 Tax=Streptomyces rimosus TaxID=1927 RepID=UPI0037CEA8F8
MSLQARDPEEEAAEGLLGRLERGAGRTAVGFGLVQEADVLDADLDADIGQGADSRLSARWPLTPVS